MIGLSRGAGWARVLIKFEVVLFVLLGVIIVSKRIFFFCDRILEKGLVVGCVGGWVGFYINLGCFLVLFYVVERGESCRL